MVAMQTILPEGSLQKGIISYPGHKHPPAIRATRNSHTVREKEPMPPKVPGTNGSGRIQPRLTGRSRLRSQQHLLDQYARQVPEASLSLQPSSIVISAVHGIPCIP